MPARTVDCQHRIDVTGAAPVCAMIERITAIADPSITRTHDDACRACRQDLRHGEPVNSVTASLVYSAMNRIIADGGHPECSVERARWLKTCAADNVSLALVPLPDCILPPFALSAGKTDAARESHPANSSLRIVAGMMTAPRADATVETALQSVAAAGFSELHLFAEPGSWIPDSLNHGVVVHRRRQRLGTLANFYSALAYLLDHYPDAEAFVMFQDDITVARGLRDWIETQLWPEGSGIVSLFTPLPHLDRTSGWRLHSPGYQRICGSQATAIRRDILQRFLSAPGVLFALPSYQHNDDAILSGWASRNGVPVAYHTPSLVAHIGNTSTLYAEGPDRRNFADAVSDVDQIDSWRPKTSPVPSRIGLCGWNTRTGLGYQNRDLARRLGIDRWLIPDHPGVESGNVYDADLAGCQLTLTDSEAFSGEQQRQWCDGLDWLLFIESPRPVNLVRSAAHLGVGIACIPNWEWLQPELSWLAFVDVMLCPTAHSLVIMDDWKQRYGFGWRTELMPWPIDGERFPFRQRERCRKFLYVNGWGGSWLRRLNGSPVAYRRKGLDIILETARIAPDLAFVITSQEPIDGPLPANVELVTGFSDNAGIYQHGDVCVQPSRFEGLGLQLLECQAAGLPLVTTDSAPMNEHKPLIAVAASQRELVDPGPGPVLAHSIDPQALAASLRTLNGTDISKASQAARAFVERRHSWSHALQILNGVLTRR